MRAGAAALAALFLLPAPAAGAAEATGAEVRALASRAVRDPAALERLREVDRVDDRPVDLRTALDGVQGLELERRLAALASAGAPVEVAPARDRAVAAEILDGPPYEEAAAPRPFRRLVDWLAGAIERPGSWLAERVPGGWYTLVLLLSAAVVAAAALASARLGARRRGAVVDRRHRDRPPSGVDPAQLEHLADDAERRGELEAALRLRFRAGLARLAALRTVPQPEHLTSRQLARALGSPRFAGLARDLDEVVYGGRAASPRDLAAAREGWPEVLREARPS